MNKPLIEKHTYEGEGYKPFIIREGWQVAKLNYLPEQDIEAIHKIDRHNQTDEVFVLLKGTAVLIGVSVMNKGIYFECVKMQSGITYNIPAGRWHNIAMRKNAEILIVEKNDTHLNDVDFRHLRDVEKKCLETKIKEELEDKF